MFEGLKQMLGMRQPDLTERKEEPRFNEELADFVNKEFERRKQERKPFELQWRLNIEFLNGNQYLDIDAQSMTIQDIPRAYFYQEREVFNQISTIAETRIARLSRQTPLMKVRPASSEQGDLSAARVSSRILQSTWHDEEMDKKYNKFIAWMEVTGTAFFAIKWNKEKGRIIHQEEAEKEEAELKQSLDEQQKELPNMEDDPFKTTVNRIMVHEGDIEIEVCSPFEIYPDNSHGDVDDTRSIIRARAYHVNDVEDWYGVKVEAEEVDVTTLQESGSGMGGLGYGATAFRGGTQTMKNHVIVKEYYERPSKRYPYGRLIIAARDKCLYAGVLPYMIGKDKEPDFPFDRGVSIETVGSFWGKSVIERCIPIQRRYNALRNRKAEYLNLVTIGQWYMPDGSVEDETTLNNSPGNLIRYRDKGDGVKPEPVMFPSLPNSFETEVDTLLSEFTSVSGVSELSRYSEAPSGVKSGVALSIATEQDDTRVGLTTNQLESVSIALGKKILRMYRQFAQEPRIIRYVGSSREIDVISWTASDLRSDDVIIDNSTALSETPAQRRQMVFDLLNTGMFNKDEQNPYSSEGIRKILEMLEFGHWEGGVSEEEELQESKAKRENKELLQGKLMPINEYDNDDLHIKEHYHFMMGDEYEQILQSEMGMFIDQMFKMHVSQHKSRQQQQMMEQQMMAMGIPPGVVPPATAEEPAEEELIEGEISEAPMSDAGVEVMK